MEQLIRLHLLGNKLLYALPLHMLSLMGHQSTIMLLSLLIIHPCKAVYKSFPFPGRLHRTQDPGCYPTPWESYEGRPTPPPPERAPPNDPTPPAVGLRQVLPPGTSKELTQGPDPPPPGSSKPRSGHPTSPPQGQKGPLIPLFHRVRRARNLSSG